MDAETVLLETEEAMQKSLDHTVQEFTGIRTGKASPALVEGIDVYVASYGSSMKLKQLAMISTPEPRMLVVTPFDPSTVQEIEKGIRESKVGINPNVDGKIIRLPIPELSEERRKDLVKVVKGMAEEGRVRIRAVRKEGLDTIKAAQKASEITEDDLHRDEKDIQKLTDDFVKKIDDALKKKETEIMTV